MSPWTPWKSNPGAHARRWRSARAQGRCCTVILVNLAFTAGCSIESGENRDRDQNLEATEVRARAHDKLDLVLVVDNSPGMAEKQSLLQEAVSGLVRHLTLPVCLDERGRPTPTSPGDGESCPPGQSPADTLLKDIHVAVVSSSLGAPGGDACGGDAEHPPMLDDRAYPLGRVREGLPSWAGTGFLAWDPEAYDPVMARNVPPGTFVLHDFETGLAAQIAAAGDRGCTYEAPLEAWYRFLIDPLPPNRISRSSGPDATRFETHADWPDFTLLEIRSRFLRPDSLVAILMVTDENDCSVIDYGQGWLVGSHTLSGAPFRLPGATISCASDPNHECCHSCASEPPAGCWRDPVCEEERSQRLAPEDDHPNLRCFNQKQRFGIDLLFPISRYVEGLTQPLVLARDGQYHPNPLFAAGQRETSGVYLGGILGVPWQDLARAESWNSDAPLEYLTYDELRDEGRLAWILGDREQYPLDGLMLETPVDRTTVTGLPQTHPALGAELAPSDTKPELAPNPINGREVKILDGSALQFACIFPLREAKLACDPSEPDCPCTTSAPDVTSPLCEGATQTRAGAHPSVRQLQVLKAIGDFSGNAIITSICPKVTDPSRASEPGYGYSPAASALTQRLNTPFERWCMGAQLPICDCVEGDDCRGRAGCGEDAEPGRTTCALIEARFPMQAGTACAPCGERPRRHDVAEPLARAARLRLRENGHCDGFDFLPRCEDFCLCELEQLRGPELRECTTASRTPPTGAGFCYIDPEQVSENDAERARAVLANCAAPAKSVLRFVGDSDHERSTVRLLVCPSTGSASQRTKTTLRP